MLNGLIWAATVSYPFLIWFSLDYLQPRYLALCMAGLFLLRFLAHNPAREGKAWAWAIPSSLVFLVVIAIVNRAEWLLAYPIFVSLTFFTVFTYSLVYPPTVIERLARLEHPDLPAKGVAYTRKVTMTWSIFFLLNAAISLFTVWYGDLRVWSLYNGVVFYILMGLLMAGEMLVRRKVRAVS